MMPARLRSKQEVPETLVAWLDKWESKIIRLKKRRSKEGSTKASGALEELEFLLARTVENQIPE